MRWLTIVLLSAAFVAPAVAETIKIGAMYGYYTHIDDIYKNIMTDAAQHINSPEENILPNGDDVAAVHFNSPTEEGWTRHSVAVAVRAACSFINNKDAHALILPDDICPYVCQGSGYIMGNAYSPTITTDQATGSDAIKMHPILEDMVELITGVIKHYRWGTFIYLYDQDTGFNMGEELMNMAPEMGWKITPIVMAEDLKQQMKDIKKLPVKNIVVYMHLEDHLTPLIEEAYEQGLLYDTWHWLFGNPNVAKLGKTFLETKLRYNSAFLTRFKMEVASSVGGNYFTRRADAIRKWPFRQQASYDAMLTVAHALRVYKEDHGGYPPSGRCGRDKSELVPSFSKINFEGCSGEVAFDDHGNRINYTISVYVGKNQYLSISKLGMFTQNTHHWEEKNGMTWPGKYGSRLYMEPYRMAEESHIHIVSIEEPPFLMRHDYEILRNPRRYRRQSYVGEDLYIGYVPELLEEIKHVFEEDMGLDFTYRLELLGEGNYGRYDKSTQEWDGMMRELFDGDADIIAGALTKTDIREDFIDFTAVWFKSQVQLLTKHPTYIWEYPFVPLFPFDVYSWLTNFLALAVASVLMWVISYLNQNEWRAKHERGEASKEEGETFTFLNTIFYMMSIMALQRFPRAPHSYTGRVMTAFWFAYTLMMVWLYVTSLAPLMKASKIAYKMRSLHDVNKQEAFDVGVVRRSPTFDLFHQATKGDKRITWDDIQTGDEKKIVQDLIDGVRKVRRDNGGYALLSEKKMLEYEALRWPCDMLITGGYVTIIKFPLAVQSGSPLRDQLTYAIKKLKKNGKLANITSKSFHDPYCKKIYKRLWHKEAKKSITGQDLAGVYYLMMLGFASTLIIFTFETVYFYLKGNNIVNKLQTYRERRGSRQRDRGSFSPAYSAQMAPSNEKYTMQDDPPPPKGGRDWL